MNQMAEMDLATTRGGTGLDGGDLPLGPLVPLPSTAYITSILALLQPRWATHVSD